MKSLGLKLKADPMARMILVVCLVALVGLFLPQAADARQPLVDFETGESLVTNLKAHRIGDLITILIVENSTADATSKTKANNKSEHSGGPGLGVLDFIKPWDMSVENKFTGDGNTKRSGNLQAEMTARITQVLHNGDFRLEGSRMVNVNGEKTMIEITGICRSEDIAPDNTIMSTYISEAQIAYTGSGLVQDAADPGVITKVFNWLF